MKLVATVKLLVDLDQKTRLLATMEKINEACTWLAERAFELRSADKIRLQKLYYRDLRDLFGLSSQHAVRAISKVCEVYKRDKTRCPTFRKYGAVVYDQRLYTFKHGLDRVSLLALDGRIVVPCAVGDYHRGRLEGVRGQADLVYRAGQLYLFVSVDVPDGSPIKPKDWLGIDLGIRNIAFDSDGKPYTGAAVERVRQRHQSLRTKLQSAGTKSAKRHLKRLSGKEARFRSNTNHIVSKCIVAKARDTARGIALEDLTYIRERVTVRKSQRATHSGWSFFQLRAFLAYKAGLAGVPVVFVDARDTSRTCTQCGCKDKANRRSQSDFVCKSCGFSDHADHVGAINIARRATVNWPPVAAIERETHSCDTSLRLVTSPFL